MDAVYHFPSQTQRQALLPPHLQIEPIRRSSAKPSRGLTSAVALAAEAGLAFGAFWLLRTRQTLLRPPLPKPTFTVELIEDPSPAPAGGQAGSGTSDPELPEPAPMPADLSQIPDRMPTRSPALFNPELPQAPGGDGRPAGQGSGEGAGVGAGIKGMGPGGIRVHIGDMEILKREDPVYPASEMANGIEDEVELEVTIDEHGVPVEVKVAKTHVPTLAAEALRAIRQWRFAAVRREGIPVRATFLLDVRFIITNKAAKAKPKV